MAYEIDFIGVNEETKDATAICMRWKNQDGSYTIGVFDGGYSTHGEELRNHLDKYYFKDNEEKVINFVVCSHPHEDHASGLTEILEKFTIESLYMNLPWSYIDELYENVTDGRVTPSSLESNLMQKYSSISALEKIANENNIPIYAALEGTNICERLTVLSPNKVFYLQLLIESDKTPSMKHSIISEAVGFVKEFVSKILETWSDEKLKEDVETEPDNETSTVILGKMEEESFLLAGDVGIRGFQEAISYATSIGISIKDDVSLYEIPHHGGRHNVSPSILNKILGKIIEEDGVPNKVAIVCSGKNSDHPLQMVVNAFRRRGVKVYKASGKTVNHHKGDMPEREGWSSASSIPFKASVEAWD